MTTLLGIDAGGTTVHVMTQRDGAPTSERIVHDAHWNTASFAERARIVTDIVAEADGPIDAVGLGAHGCDSDAQRDELLAEVRSRLTTPVAVVNDAVLFGYAMDEPAAVDVVLGTGSIAVVRRGPHTGCFGGWGWLVGDDGSAWGLVRTAVRRLAQDGDDPLSAALCARAGVADLRALVDLMQRSAPTQWAQWVDAVFAAEERSPIAAATIAAGVEHTLSIIAQALADAPDAPCVVFGGGVVEHQSGYAQRMMTATTARFGMPALLLDRPPVHGALRLAQESLTSPEAFS